MIEGSYLGIEFNNIILALAILLGSFIVGKALYYFFKTWGRRITAATKSNLDDVLIDVMEEPIVIITILIGIYFAFSALGVKDPGTVSMFNNTLGVVGILVATYLAVKVLDTIVQGVLIPFSEKTESHLDDQLLPIVSKGGKLIIVIMGSIIALAQIGVDVTALIAGLGIAGLAVAFAAQETIANIFGGVFLLIDKTFKSGDKVKLEGGEWGYIDDISLRSTKIRTVDNELLIVPNATLANSKVLNYTKPAAKTRSKIELTMVYGTDSKKLKAKALEIVEAHPNVLKDPKPGVFFKEMGAHSINFLCTFWVQDWGEIWGVKCDLNDQLYNGLQKAGFEFAFPTQTIYLEK